MRELADPEGDEEQGATEPDEPIAMEGVGGGGGFIVEVEGGGHGGEGGEELAELASGIDGGGVAVVGDAEDPAAIFDGPEADEEEVLFAGGRAEEVAIVGEVEEDFGTLGDEGADVMGDGGFIADEDAPTVGGLGGLGSLGGLGGEEGGGGGGAGRVGADFGADLIDPGKERGDEFAKGDEEDLVVTGERVAGGVDELGGVKGATGRGAADGAKQEGGVVGGGELGDGLAEVRIFAVEDGGGGFGPDDGEARAGGGGREGFEAEAHGAFGIFGPFFVDGEVGLDGDDGVAGGGPRGEGGEGDGEEAEEGGGGVVARVTEEDGGEGEVQEGEEPTDTIDAEERGDAHGEFRIDGGVAEHGPSKAVEGLLRAFMKDPEEGGGGDAVGMAKEDAGEEGEEADVAAFGETEEGEGAPAGPGTHATVDGEDLGDPVTEQGPEDNAGGEP